MLSFLKKCALMLAMAAIFPWPGTCMAAGLNNWGSAYAQAETQRQNRVARLEAQGFVSPGEEELPPPRVSEREVAIELARLTASLLVPGLGVVLWLADRSSP